MSFREAIQGFLHRRSALVDHGADDVFEIIGQEVGDPNNAALIVAMCEDLRRCIVVGQWSSDRRPGEPARVIVEIDDQLLHDHAGAKRYNPRTRLQARINNETGYKPVMQGSNIPNGRPGVCRGRFAQNFFPN